MSSISRWSITVEDGERKLWLVRINRSELGSNDFLRVVKIGYEARSISTIVHKQIWSFNKRGVFTSKQAYDYGSIEEAAQGEIDHNGWRTLWDGTDE